MKKCEGLNPSSLEWCSGTPQMPGIRKDVYFIPKRDIVKWPTLPTTITTSMAEFGEFKGDFELAEAAKWKRLVVLVDKSPCTSESQGEKPSASFLNKLTALYPGTNAEAAGFCSLAANEDYVYLVQDKVGKFRVIGNDMYETTTKPSMALGATPTDAMGTTLEISVTDRTPLPTYVGQIVTEDGIINETPKLPA